MSTAERIMTAVELLQTPGLGRCELVRGELIQMTPAGFEHGRIAANIGWALSERVGPHAERGNRKNVAGLRSA